MPETATLQLPDRTAGVLTREEIAFGDSTVEVLVGGTGAPLLLLHGIDGGVHWDAVVHALRDDFTIYMPSHPGFNGSARPDWVRSIFDLAAFYNRLLEQIPRPVAAIGHSFGGWLAAEIAARGAGFDRLVLVDAMGLEPPGDGEIADVFLLTPAQFAGLGFHGADARERFVATFDTDLAARWMHDRNLEMSSRVAWKPYMVDPSLHGLLPLVKGHTRIVWGADDGIVPLGCGERYRDLIPDADLVVIPDCGHHPHVERPEEFARAVKEFLL